MDISKFISRLGQYIDKKINYEIVDYTLKVHVNNEVYYNFDRCHMKVDIYERNVKTEIGSWNSEKVANVNFAMLMRNVFANDKGDTIPRELDECDSLDKLKHIMDTYADDKYYSIGSAQMGKVSIIVDEDFEILYRTNNRKYRIDKDTDTKYIFGRFYHEVACFSSFMKNLRDYELIFDETFSEEEVVNLIGY